MATIHCPGGHSFSDGEIPSPYAYTLISEGNLEVAVEAIVAGIAAGGNVGDQVDAFIRSNGSSTYICPECGRILVFEKGLENPATSYRRE